MDLSRLPAVLLEAFAAEPRGGRRLDAAIADHLWATCGWTPSHDQIRVDRCVNGGYCRSQSRRHQEGDTREILVNGMSWGHARAKGFSDHDRLADRYQVPEWSRHLDVAMLLVPPSERGARLDEALARLRAPDGALPADAAERLPALTVLCELERRATPSAR